MRPAIHPFGAGRGRCRRLDHPLHFCIPARYALRMAVETAPSPSGRLVAGGAFRHPGPTPPAFRIGPYTFKAADTEDEIEQVHRLNYATFVREIPQHADPGDGRLV